MYHSIVLVKQVPDTANITGNVMQDDGTVNRAKLPAIFNPEDRVALEMALRVKDQFGGKITVMTMGPPRASDILRECLYMGADEGVLISDRKFAGADTLATSYVLSEAIKKEGAYDFIFAGRQAIDGDTAQVGPQTCEKLGIPQITYLEEIQKVEGKTLTAKRKIEGGYRSGEVHAACARHRHQGCRRTPSFQREARHGLQGRQVADGDREDGGREFAAVRRPAPCMNTNRASCSSAR